MMTRKSERNFDVLDAEQLLEACSWWPVLMANNSINISATPHLRRKAHPRKALIEKDADAKKE